MRRLESIYVWNMIRCYLKADPFSCSNLKKKRPKEHGALSSWPRHAHSKLYADLADDEQCNRKRFGYAYDYFVVLSWMGRDGEERERIEKESHAWHWIGNLSKELWQAKVKINEKQMNQQQ